MDDYSAWTTSSTVTGTLTTSGTSSATYWTGGWESPGDSSGVREPRRPKPSAPPGVMELAEV